MNTVVQLLLSAPLMALQPQTPAADTVFLHVLDPVVIEGRFDDLIGTARSASEGFVGLRDLRLRPLVREGELLETVPGLIMTQHSGDGKANQMFVRGFNLDHGTDFSTKVEGMPVNLPAHGHGQGYTDLNFLIPELVDHVDYRLGTHHAEIGDFGAAGGAHFRLRRDLDAPLLATTFGENGYLRVIGAGSTPVGPGTLLTGAELKGYNGPWSVPQDLRKFAGAARYSWQSGRNALSILGLAYSNDWNASDQIPLRAVQSGSIDPFAQIDSTLGGSSSRYSLSGSWTRRGSESSQRLDVYSILYDLDLYSNFTYQLENPLEGDQFRQTDRDRLIMGANFAHVQPVGRHTVTVGTQARRDHFDNSLAWSRARTPLETIRADEGSQTSLGAYLEAETHWAAQFRSVLALRGDHYRFDVTSDLSANSGATTDNIFSPKGSLIYTPSARTELYLSGGFGFHSNDARGTVQTIEPDSGDPTDPASPLVRARGAELGLRLSPVADWHSTLSLWTVELDSELVFEGDTGATAPSDASQRLGVTWTNVHRLSTELTVDLDVTFSRARFLDVDADEAFIPGALENVIAAGIAWESQGNGPLAALRLRRFGAYPLIEDNAERAPATTLLNLNTGWHFGRIRAGVSVLNLLDSDGSDIQYLYESRLAGEPAGGVEDVHFHPVEPRQLRLTLSWGL